MTQSISLPTTGSTTFDRVAVQDNLPARPATGHWARLRRNPTAVIGLVIVITYLLLALVGEWLAPYAYTEQHLSDTLQPPSMRYWFGTDQFGRDILSRVIVGSRSMIILALGATALALLLGAGTGVVAAYFGGWIDEILMRVADVMLAFPALLLALLILSTLGSEMIYLIICIGVVFAPAIARVVRSVVLELRTREFVEAARMIGSSHSRIMRREILPNLLSTLLVEAAIFFGYAILVGSGLGFLGMGVQPPSPDWGLQVNDGRNFLLTAPWVVLFPAVAISSLVIGVNLLVDGLGVDHK
ncbi:MAG: ABC transporter permease [Caldilinea sp. CFX5]|nr:ABC transporter permease [Caldilinea sp. CFX5]